jgi:putative flippase GtrA
MINGLEHLSGERALRHGYGDRPSAHALDPARRLWRSGLQYGRFGTVGAAATTLHAAMFAALIELAGISPLVANAVAFGVALPLSFVGHRHWTFRAADGDRPALRSATGTMSKFVVVALLGVCLNSLAVYVITETLNLPYACSLPLMVSVVPLAVFLLSKFWAFT